MDGGCPGGQPPSGMVKSLFGTDQIPCDPAVTVELKTSAPS